MSKSPIEWTNYTWNVIRGCSRVSTGCEQCYAERTAYRFNAPGQPYEGLTRMTSNGPRWTGKIRLVPEKLDEPLRIKKPTRIFVNSMSDLFHEDVPDSFIEKIFNVMEQCGAKCSATGNSCHTFQILTKRPERMRDFMNQWWDSYRAEGVEPNMDHIWLGVSVEDQPTANERIPVLLRTPAAVHWISAEPLLGSIDFTSIYRTEDNWTFVDDVLSGFRAHKCGGYTDPERYAINWVVVGGESGPKARPMVLGWAKDIVRQCKSADVPVFVKQLGANPTNREGETCTHIKHKKGADVSEWPDELRVQQYPNQENA